MQTGKPVRESAELETVTDKEMMRLNRREANKSFGVRLTELLPFNSAGQDFQSLTAGGLFWLYDARSWMADIAVDIGGGAQGRFFIDASLGAYYPFLREDFTPYLGAQIRWAEMSSVVRGRAAWSFSRRWGSCSADSPPCRSAPRSATSSTPSASRRSTPPRITVRPGTVPTHYSQGFVFSAGIGF